MIKAGDDKWENQVGTGPFQFEEYVPGSHMSYVKNKNYWMKTVIDGKEYQLPFIDRFVTPIIPDQATQVAALRTARLDFMQFVPPSYWPSLEGTGLMSAKYSNSVHMINMLMLEPPFNDIRVRKALRIATDVKAFQRLNFSDALPRHVYPIHYQHPAYIPEDKLPADIKELYDYNPEKAKQLLAEAGYPNGITIDLYADSTAVNQDNAALAKDLWAKAGITANIVVHDPITHTNFTYNKNYHGTILQSNEIANPINSLYRFGHSEGYVNHSAWNSPEYDAIVEQLATELDPAKQLPLMEKAQLLMLRAIPVVPLHPLVEGHFWWPWLKNYDGEVTVTDGSPHSLVQWIWIDANLKKTMGF
jgi:peptide/nickel transport system substrate-binding protein